MLLCTGDWINQLFVPVHSGGTENFMDCFVKASYGVIWHFYHNRHGICFCKMRDEKITEYQVLLPDARDDFDVITDDSDVIHLVCQNTDGDIIYVNHRDGEWKKATVLKSKRSTSYSKDFVIRRMGNWLNLFYCIEYNGNRMLTHQILERDDVSPFVIDCIKDVFCAAQDGLGNIYLLFYSETKKSYGVRRYVWSQKNWEEFVPYEQLDGAKKPYLYIDGEDKIHIIFEIDGCIKHLCEGKTEILGAGTSPIMMFQRNLIYMWEGLNDNKIYIRHPEDSSPTVFMPGGFSKPARMRLRYTSFEPDINADLCLGNISDGSVKTYGIKNFFNVSQTPPSIVPQQTAAHSRPDGNGAYIELQKLKIQLGQLETALEKLQSGISGLDVQKIEKRLAELEETVDKRVKNKLFSWFL